MDRIDLLQISDTNLSENLFYVGPEEFLINAIKDEIKKVTQFNALFGDSIDAYQRQDYSIRELPALRMYTERFTKEFDSWFVAGDLKVDIIYPASLRRDQLMQYQMTISSAIIQQFRRVSFFNAITEKVPGLNELGKRVDIDTSLGFQREEEIVPLTQITLNFRIDLRIWDDYLTQTNRTKDEPFCETIVDLDRIVSVIQGLKDNQDLELETKVDQKV